jgi:hypothetical protein
LNLAAAHLPHERSAEAQPQNESTNAFEEGEATSEDTSPVEVLVVPHYVRHGLVCGTAVLLCIFVSEFEFMPVDIPGTCFVSDNVS